MLMFKNRRILITGGNGFIGTHLAARCKKEGGKVFIIDRKTSSITDKIKLHSIVKKIRPHVVFHLAALINRSRAPELLTEMYDVHVNGTKNLIEALQGDPDLQMMIYLGTMEEYGTGKAPFREEQEEAPVSPYSLTKTLATKIVQHYAKHESFPAVVVRPSLVYGPGQKSDMFIPSVIRSCLLKKDFSMTLGEQTRDFVYITDLIDALLKIVRMPKLRGEIINIGSGKEVAIKKVAVLINKLLDNPVTIKCGAVPYRKDENMHMWLDSGKARSKLKWKPKVPLEEGLITTIASHKK